MEGNGSNNSPQNAKNKPVMDSSRSIHDAQAVNAKQLLNAYIYDFLVKSRLPQTARIFVNEAEVPSSPASQTLNPHNPGSQEQYQNQNQSQNQNQNQSQNQNQNHINQAQAGTHGSIKNSPQINSPTASHNNSTQFLKENNLPNLAVAMDAPQGFLFEWWLVFWDVFQAKNGPNPGNGNIAPNGVPNPNNVALQYYQLQLLKQRQQHEIQGLNVLPAMLGGLSNGVPGAAQFHPQQMQHQNHPHLMMQQLPLQTLQLQPTLQQQQNFQQQQQQQQQLQQLQQIQQQTGSLDPQQRHAMQMIMKQQQQQQQQQQQAAKSLNMSMGGAPLDPQQHQQFLASLGPNANNLNIQQQLFLSQQSQNKIQQHAQTQMNNLRQQAAAAQHQQEQIDEPNKGPIQGQIQAQGQPGPGPNSAPGMQQTSKKMQYPPQVTVNGSQSLSPYPQSSPQMTRMNSQGNIPIQSPLMVNSNNMMNKNGATMQMNANGANGAAGGANGANRNLNALQDYQMQLMLLEKQNKKRLDIARDGGANEQNSSFLGTGMLPPQGQQNAQLGPQHPQISQKLSPATASNSPVINSKSSPNTVGKKKKEPPAKRGRKASTSNASSGGNPNINTAVTNTPSLLKKEYNTPLTPTSESANESKRKNVSTGDSPKKLPKNSKKEKTIKEESSSTFSTNNKKVDDDLAPPSITSAFNDAITSNEHAFPVEIISNSAEPQGYFGTGAQPSLDDIDFDFNQFLDGNGDSGLNDGIGGFSWGNVDAIED